MKALAIFLAVSLSSCTYTLSPGGKRSIAVDPESVHTLIDILADK